MIYTNGVYKISGLVKGKGKYARVIGTIIETEYPNVYDIGHIVNFQLYHTKRHKYPQFLNNNQIREKKLERILSENA